MRSQKHVPSVGEGSKIKNQKSLGDLKVALIHDFLMQWGGAEQILQQFGQIFPQADIFSICSDQALINQHFRSHRVINSFIQKFPMLKKLYKAYILFMPKAIESFNFDKYDLVISDSSAFAKGAITSDKTLHICYLHTPTRYLWDIPDFYLKTAVPALLRPIMKLYLPILKKWDLKASKRPDKLIVISKTIWKRTRKYYHRTPDALIYPFFDESKYSIISHKLDDYYLIAGRLVPYKRYDIVIEAFNRLQLPLIVIGAGYGSKELVKLNTNRKTKFLGFVSDKELIKYYNGCRAYIFPANEDFGITPVEAMALGRPVIAYSQGGAGESVVDGKTGILFNEQSSKEVENAVKKIPKYRFDSKAIREHALKFSKKRFTNEIVEFINKTIERN